MIDVAIIRRVAENLYNENQRNYCATAQFIEDRAIAIKAAENFGHGSGMAKCASLIMQLIDGELTERDFEHE